jgi:5'-nucleotidase/UDP-sugar diphosphatase
MQVNSAGTPQPKRLTMLFTSDEHGAIRPAPSLQAEIDGMRQANPNGSLVISGGDVFQGAPESEMAHGKPALELLPKAGYDLVTLGNHDFDYGQEFLGEWTNHATYPILSANVRGKDGQMLPGVQASIIKEMDGYKVGFIGVTTQTTPEICLKENVKGLDFQDPVPAVKAEIQKLRDQGANLIGLIAHTEEREEERIAAEVQGIDFILGGHTHQVYKDAKVASGVPVYRSGSSREAIGKLSIDIDPVSLRPTHQDWQIIAANSDSRHEGEVQELVDKQVKAYDKEMGVQLGFTALGLNTNYDAQGDAMDRLMAKGIALEAGTTIGFHNQKTVRSSLQEGYMTKGDTRRVFPFPNHVQRVEVSYEEMLETVRLSEQRNDHTSLFFDGLQVERDSSGLAVELRDSKGLRLPDTFAVGTTDFIGSGGLGYFKTPKEGPITRLLADVLPNALTQMNFETEVHNGFWGIPSQVLGE